jgi:bacterioferritin (cytochrome b1)
MERLAEKHKDKVIDLLTERLTFERSGVKLYDSILQKMQASTDPQVGRMLGQMREHRNEEKEHEEWLEAQIRKLGGDAHGTTDMSSLVATESKGIEQVVLDGDPSISHMFHALLTAELVDNAGWELLLELADDADDDIARREFRMRLKNEQDHLIFVRRAVVAFARKMVLDQAVPMPTSP